VWPYLLMFVSAALIAAPRPGVAGPYRASDPWSAPWLLAYVALVLVIGLRHEVGGDWDTYLVHVELADWRTWAEVVEYLADYGDPAYAVLNLLGASGLGGIYFVNLACAAIFSTGLLMFCRTQPRPWLALVVAAPYLVIVVAMGYSRQGVAIGLVMLAMAALTEGMLRRYVFWIAAAALFHKSALILLPFALFAARTRRFTTLVGVAMASILLFAMLISESLPRLTTNYVEAELSSAGAGIRVAMNALPALVFLAFRSRFRLEGGQKSYWTAMALTALGFVVALAATSSSTAVDRLALYCIPLQLFVLARLPGALGDTAQARSLWVYAVIVYSATTMLVWLSLAVHAIYWLPYKFYPWEMLWR
jgi:hypothetical protein